MSQKSKDIRLKINLEKIQTEDIESIFILMNLEFTGDYTKDIISLFKFIDLHYVGKETDDNYGLIKHLI